MSINDAVTGAYSDDIKSQPVGNYQYNSIGQLAKDAQVDYNYTYNLAGNVTAVRKTNGVTLATFEYNEAGLRQKKTAYDGSGNATTHTWYVYDAGGALLSTYETNVSTGITSQKELQVYGAGRLGVYSRTSSSYIYELTDHLGNVRATIRNNAGNAEVMTFADYYPHGSTMPFRSYQPDAYKFAYQGQEKDETGFLNFELRQYDPRIGRWFNPDPMGQYHSPYLAMGNNPISFIDPTGGQSAEGGSSSDVDGVDDRGINNIYLSGYWLGKSGSNNDWWNEWNHKNDFAPRMDAFENKINADNSYRDKLHEFWDYKAAHYKEDSENWGYYKDLADANGIKYSAFHRDDSYRRERPLNNSTKALIGAGGGLSPLSFQFEPTTSNWQVAGVAGLNFQFEIANEPGTWQIVTFNIEVGLPMQLINKTIISDIFAAETSAKVANDVASIIGKKYAKQYYVPGIGELLKYDFAKQMQLSLGKIIPGARVTSPRIPSVKPTPAIYSPPTNFLDDVIDLILGK